MTEAKKKVRKSKSSSRKSSSKKRVVEKVVVRKVIKKKATKRESTNIKVEVEFDDGKAEVEVNINGKRKEFTLRTADQETAISQIAKKTGISVNKLKKIIEFDDWIKNKNGTS